MKRGIECRQCTLMYPSFMIVRDVVCVRCEAEIRKSHCPFCYFRHVDRCADIESGKLHGGGSTSGWSGGGAEHRGAKKPEAYSVSAVFDDDPAGGAKQMVSTRDGSSLRGSCSSSAFTPGLTGAPWEGTSAHLVKPRRDFLSVVASMICWLFFYVECQEKVTPSTKWKISPSEAPPSRSHRTHQALAARCCLMLPRTRRRPSRSV